ncbi:protein translocase subunit SecD [Salinibacterium sp. dk2585]|uniref:protein translocase subunit SecD n=1 Tax=unclassified Salinibacterium TaxID=2632331 RepID=UPI0011C24354|nr:MULTISPECIES: protein translocase subunit SecD [unclassified Salinibacterium]QEE61294.1 protein translocase subunit SecD [Salinibacterium sp. dk2585]TXK53970.1 protein translocase subunit SecD [Salinibacterium sp. dk5596]
MAAPRSTPAKKAWRSLTWLAVIIVGLIGLNAAGAIWQGSGWTPKLALDLEGGTQIILAPQLESGQQVTGEQLDQAVEIIRSRVDAAGVSEAEINTQGAQNIVVSIPGTPDEETLARIESSAKLEFRPVLQVASAVDATQAPAPETGEGEGTDDTEPSPSVSPSAGAGQGGAAPATAETPAPSASPSPSAEADPAQPGEGEPTPTPSNASDLAWITPELLDEFTNFDCAELDEAGTNVAPAAKPLITCDSTRTVKYILGPVEVAGERIVDATHGLASNSQGVSTGQWAVNIVFDGEGSEEFGEVTTRLFSLTGVQNQFAIVLDGTVISAPRTNTIITNGKPQITGDFTQDTAKVLADQLKFGALPIGFEVQSSENISATLGESQLWSGLLAGVIGLALVVAYSLFQYRTLGLVTVASLGVAGVIVYLVINLMSWREGYRLSLAGVAGLIVAIGIIADSFIVYFERIKDELRDGRMLGSAVEAGWKRAIRTVLASDAVNFLAAAVLFVLAIGNVRGFALTLGITTLIDLLVVSLFTHPVMQLLAKTKFFGEGHPASGLNPRALGAVYRGRATFREPVGVSASKRASSVREAQKRQTIAERKAAADAAASVSKGKDS